MAKRTSKKKELVTIPPFRKLRGFAFDPSTSLDLSTSEINQIVYKIPWESDLKPGPEGEYVKIIDRDPASGAFYTPVDLNRPDLLATDGVAPSETNPLFHQQMVYAVIMTTIKNFEKALGRKVMWSPFVGTLKSIFGYHFVEKLVVFPHALRDQNAYYSPERKALLFGYYNATPVNTESFMPGAIVYSCLSHDIVAHETTHALLDGMYSRFMESTNPDVPAFHEGFADIVALLQHFTQADIVRNQIRKVKGQLDAENLLAKLAVEFGQSTGEYGALRDFIGTNLTGKWKRRAPNTKDYDEVLECHDRGALLVSAVFDAFLAIYNNRTADLLRLASGGTGILPQGDLHPDLINRLADEASKSAAHVLNMCVRALDYCPPVDITFGDFLRALITADAELVPDDSGNYRIAFINAFRKRGIFPQGIPNLSVETLAYNRVDNEQAKGWFSEKAFEFLREFKTELAYTTNRREIFEKTAAFIGGKRQTSEKGKRPVAAQSGFHTLLFDKTWKKADEKLFEKLTGLVISSNYQKLGIKTSKTYKHGPSIEIHSLRIHNRVGPDGRLLNQMIMTLAQRCDLEPIVNQKSDSVRFALYKKKASDPGKKKITFRGGCTLIFDLDDLQLKHVISKPIHNLDPTSGTSSKLTWNEARLNLQYECTFGKLAEELGFASSFEPLSKVHKSRTPLI